MGGELGKAWPFTRFACPHEHGAWPDRAAGTGLSIARIRFRLRGMESTVLAKEALKLPPLERAQIIDALWQSFDSAEQAAIDRAWTLESQERLAAFRSGKVAAVDGEDALREMH